MRTPNLGTFQYVAGDPTGITTIAELVRFIRDQELRTERAFAALAAGHFDPIPAPPAKPRDGDIRHADGTHWNPGGGKGIYYYDGIAWNQLG